MIGMRVILWIHLFRPFRETLQRVLGSRTNEQIYLRAYIQHRDLINRISQSIIVLILIPTERAIYNFPLQREIEY